MRKSKWAAPVAVFLTALALRLLFLRDWSRTPFYLYPQLDDQIYLVWAKNILKGDVIRHTAFFQSPLYPYLMALVFKIVGVKPQVVLWLQALAGAMAAPVLFLVTERLFTRRAGLFAGLFAALYGPFMFFGVLFLKETWLILGLSLFLLLLLKTEDSGKAWLGFVCGAVLGLCALLQGNALLLAPVPLLGWLRGSGRGSRRSALAFTAGLVLAILPATIHNALASRDFVPISYNTGFSLYMGNNPQASGTMGLPHGISAHPLLEEIQSSELARGKSGKDLSPSQVSRYWFGASIRYVLKHPGGWLKLTTRKFYLFWNRYELPDNYDILFIRRNFSTPLRWPLPSFSIAASLGVFGIALFWRKSRMSRLLLGLFAVYMLTVVGASVTGRYRLASLVFLIPFVGAALDRIFTPGLVRGLKGHGWALSAALGLIAICHYPWPRYSDKEKAGGWSIVAQVLFERGNYKATVSAFTTALDASPLAVGEAAFLAAGASAERLGERESARLIYKTGTEVHPGSGDMRRRLDSLEE